MKKSLCLKVMLAYLLGALFINGATPVATYADEDTGSDESTSETQSSSPNVGTSISLMPVSKILQISPSSEYTDTLTVNNDGDGEIEIEVFAAPYAYTFSDDEQMYKLGFNTETNFTQIFRWVSFQKNDGSWSEKALFKIPAHDKVEVKYMISTPSKIPAGGQYAVIFAHTLTGVISASGIRTEASPGMVLFGRSTEGEVTMAAQISDMNIQYGTYSDDTQKSYFYGTAKVKNDGNMDFNASGTLKVSPIIGFGSYETSSGRGIVSVIPEAELKVSDRWDDSPSFGIYKVSWTVKAGDETETIETVIFVNPLIAIIIILIVLTIITIWTILILRRRKARNSRLAV